MPIRLTVIGGGPGGYTAAFAAARAGMSVTLVESGNLGGTCLNNGCIPTKTLKASVDALELALRLSQFGITVQGAPAVDPAAVLARKEKVCATLRGGLEKACASLGVRLLKGRGRLVHAGLVEASTAEGPVSVEGDRVILATGSGALELPGLPVDHTHILTSDDALALDRVPASIAIVGGGVIGCELAFIYQAFGSKVTVVEGQNRLLPLPSVDADMSALLQREMKKRRIGCELGRTLKDVRVEGGMVRAMLGASPFIKEPTPAQMKETPIEAETVLVTVGRAPNTAGLGLAEAGVAVDGRGWIRADEHMRTSLPGVYAVGDALGPSKIMLAHVAAAEGLCAVRDCLGHDGRMDYSAVPSGIFTSPEIGCVGLAEAQASEAGRDVRTATFQMRELGKAQAMSELPGMFKIVSDGATGKVLGVHIAGAHATDLIAEAGLALRLGRVRPGHRLNHPRPPHLGGGPVRSRAFPRRGWRMKHWGRETLLKKGEPAFPLPQAPPSHSKGFRIYPIPVHGVPQNRFPLGYSAVQIEYIPRKGTSHEKQ